MVGSWAVKRRVRVIKKMWSVVGCMHDKRRPVAGVGKARAAHRHGGVASKRVVDLTVVDGELACTVGGEHTDKVL